MFNEDIKFLSNVNNKLEFNENEHFAKHLQRYKVKKKSARTMEVKAVIIAVYENEVTHFK